jgi:hypothetical protein
MEEVQQNVQQAINVADQGMQMAFANPYINAAVITFLILYGALAAPALPPMIAKLFDYTWFKIIMIACILLIARHNPIVALLMAVVFFLSIQTLSKWKLGALAQQVTVQRKAREAGAQAQAEVQSQAQAVPVFGGNVSKSPVSISAAAPMHSASQEISADANETEVSGLVGRAQEYMGAQGMSGISGYSGQGLGANYDSSF